MGDPKSETHLDLFAVASFQQGLVAPPVVPSIVGGRNVFLLHRACASLGGRLARAPFLTSVLAAEQYSQSLTGRCLAGDTRLLSTSTHSPDVTWRTFEPS